MCNVHGAEMSESWVMDNSSLKDPVKLCTSSSVMSGYSVLADTVISIYITLKSGSTHHRGGSYGASVYCRQIYSCLQQELLLIAFMM